MEAKLKDALYTASATSTGGRNGHTENSTRVVSVDLSTPKSMGGMGKPNTTTPEDLFAAGYAACFGSACDFAARSMLKLKPSQIVVETKVTLGTDTAGGFALKVGLIASIGGLSEAEAHKLVETAHQICPYSKATRGNVEVQLETRLL